MLLGMSEDPHPMSVPARRMHELVCAVWAEEKDNKRTASRLGIDENKVSKWKGGHHNHVRAGTLHTVSRRLGLRCDYFFANSSESLDYRDFLYCQSVDPAHEAWREFYSLYGHLYSAPELETLRLMRFVNLRPTVRAYVALVAGLQLCEPVPESGETSVP